MDHHEPSEEEIRAKAAAIRAAWTDKQLARRRNQEQAPHWTVPEVPISGIITDDEWNEQC